MANVWDEPNQPTLWADEIGPYQNVWHYLLEWRAHPERSFGFMVLPSDYLRHRMLGCTHAYPDMHPWARYPMYPYRERRYKGGLVFSAVTADIIAPPSPQAFALSSGT